MKIVQLKKFFLKSFACFWVTPGIAQGILLILCSVITHDGAQTTMWGAGIEPGLATYKASTWLAVLSLQPPWGLLTEKIKTENISKLITEHPIFV